MMNKYKKLYNYFVDINIFEISINMKFQNLYKKNIIL